MNEKMKLSELIQKYAVEKNQLDMCKNICDKLNTDIKRIMQDEQLDEYTAGNYTAKITVSQRTAINEDKILLRVKELDRFDLIKTKEYVDTDLLEKALYQQEIAPDDISDCFNTKDITTLKIKKAKGDTNGAKN